MESARTERVASAVLASQGVKDQSGRPITMTNPQAELEAFHRRLYEPLDAQATREAMIKEARG